MTSTSRAHSDKRAPGSIRITLVSQYRIGRDSALLQDAGHPAMKHIFILTGAGISAESGLPTFRDKDGLREGWKSRLLPFHTSTPARAGVL